MRIAGRRAQGLFSQVTYCGGYSGEVPPLPIPNREVKLTHADGTDPPVGRVGSRRSSEALSSARLAGLLCFVAAQLCGAGALLRRSTLPAPLPSANVLPAPLRRFAGICSALTAPLCRSAGIRQRSPCFASALPHFPVRALPALLCCSAGICRALPAPLRRFGTGFIPQRNSV